MKGKRWCVKLLSLPILASVSLMGFVYFATIFVFVDDLFGLNTAPGVVNALLFTWIQLACLHSFFLAALLDPGIIPASYVLDIVDPEKNDLPSRYCDKCCVYKPPRSHHCRVCRRCVLKMDHHCRWINNCVGYANYKAFITFVLHAAVGSVYSTVIYFKSITHMDHDFQTLSIKLFYVSCAVVLFLLCLSLCSLYIWHIYLLSQNMTTIEYQESVRAKWLAKKRGQKYHHPFDIGMYHNISTVLGPNFICWFCPAATDHLKNGMSFPTSREESPTL